MGKKSKARTRVEQLIIDQAQQIAHSRDTQRQISAAKFTSRIFSLFSAAPPTLREELAQIKKFLGAVHKEFGPALLPAFINNVSVLSARDPQKKLPAVFDQLLIGFLRFVSQQFGSPTALRVCSEKTTASGIETQKKLTEIFSNPIQISISPRPEPFVWVPEKHYIELIAQLLQPFLSGWVMQQKYQVDQTLRLVATNQAKLIATPVSASTAQPVSSVFASVIDSANQVASRLDNALGLNELTLFPVAEAARATPAKKSAAASSTAEISVPVESQPVSDINQVLNLNTETQDLRQLTDRLREKHVQQRSEIANLKIQLRDRRKVLLAELTARYEETSALQDPQKIRIRRAAILVTLFSGDFLKAFLANSPQTDLETHNEALEFLGKAAAEDIQVALLCIKEMYKEDMSRAATVSNALLTKIFIDSTTAYSAVTVEHIEELFQYGANPFVGPAKPGDEYPLVIGLKGNNLAVYQAFANVVRQKLPEEVKTFGSDIPLHFFVMLAEVNESLALALLDYFVALVSDIDTPITGGVTALHSAVYLESEVMVNRLLAYSAQPEKVFTKEALRTHLGNTPAGFTKRDGFHFHTIISEQLNAFELAAQLRSRSMGRILLHAYPDRQFIETPAITYLLQHVMHSDGFSDAERDAAKTAILKMCEEDQRRLNATTEWPLYPPIDSAFAAKLQVNDERGMQLARAVINRDGKQYQLLRDKYPFTGNWLQYARLAAINADISTLEIIFTDIMHTMQAAGHPTAEITTALNLALVNALKAAILHNHPSQVINFISILLTCGIDLGGEDNIELVLLVARLDNNAQVIQGIEKFVELFKHPILLLIKQEMLTGATLLKQWRGTNQRMLTAAFDNDVTRYVGKDLSAQTLNDLAYAFTTTENLPGLQALLAARYQSKDLDYSPLLGIAARWGSPAMIRTLGRFAHQANRTEEISVALEKALRLPRDKDFGEIIKTLLEMGADPRAICKEGNAKGHSILEFAQRLALDNPEVRAPLQEALKVLEAHDRAANKVPSKKKSSKQKNAAARNQVTDTPQELLDYTANVFAQTALVSDQAQAAGMKIASLITLFTKIDINNPHIDEAILNKALDYLALIAAENMLMPLRLIKEIHAIHPAIATTLSNLLISGIFTDTTAAFGTVTVEHVAELLNYGGSIFVPPKNAADKYPVVVGLQNNNKVVIQVFAAFYKTHFAKEVQAFGADIPFPILVTLAPTNVNLALDLFAYFISRVPSVDAPITGGVTALHLAVFYGLTEIVTRLLEYHANPAAVFQLAALQELTKKLGYSQKIKNHRLTFEAISSPQLNALELAEQLNQHAIHALLTEKVKPQFIQTPVTSTVPETQQTFWSSTIDRFWSWKTIAVVLLFYLIWDTNKKVLGPIRHLKELQQATMGRMNSVLAKHKLPLTHQVREWSLTNLLKSGIAIIMQRMKFPGQDGTIRKWLKFNVIVSFDSNQRKDEKLLQKLVGVIQKTLEQSGRKYEFHVDRSGTVLQVNFANLLGGTKRFVPAELDQLEQNLINNLAKQQLLPAPAKPAQSAAAAPPSAAAVPSVIPVLSAEEKAAAQAQEEKQKISRLHDELSQQLKKLNFPAAFFNIAKVADLDQVKLSLYGEVKDSLPSEYVSQFSETEFFAELAKVLPGAILSADGKVLELGNNVPLERVAAIYEYFMAQHRDHSKLVDANAELYKALSRLSNPKIKFTCRSAGTTLELHCDASESDFVPLFFQAAKIVFPQTHFVVIQQEHIITIKRTALDHVSIRRQLGKLFEKYSEFKEPVVAEQNRADEERNRRAEEELRRIEQAARQRVAEERRLFAEARSAAAVAAVNPQDDSDGDEKGGPDEVLPGEANSDDDVAGPDAAEEDAGDDADEQDQEIPPGAGSEVDSEDERPAASPATLGEPLPRTRKIVTDDEAIEAINHYAKQMGIYLEVKEDLEYSNYAEAFCVVRYFVYLQQYVCNKPGDQDRAIEDACINLNNMLAHHGLNKVINSPALHQTAAIIKTRTMDSEAKGVLPAPLSEAEITGLPIFKAVRTALIEQGPAELAALVNQAGRPVAYYEKLAEQWVVLSQIAQSLSQAEDLDGVIAYARKRPQDKNSDCYQQYFHTEAILRTVLTIIGDAWVPEKGSAQNNIVKCLKQKLTNPRDEKKLVKLLQDFRKIRNAVRHERDGKLLPGAAILKVLNGFRSLKLLDGRALFKAKPVAQAAAPRSAGAVSTGVSSAASSAASAGTNGATASRTSTAQVIHATSARSPESRRKRRSGDARSGHDREERRRSSGAAAAEAVSPSVSSSSAASSTISSPSTNASLASGVSSGSSSSSSSLFSRSNGASAAAGSDAGRVNQPPVAGLAPQQ